MHKTIATWARYGLAMAVMLVIAGNYSAMASPFGQGVFGADVPFGSGTSMSIALSGTVTLNVTDPGDGTFVGEGSHTVTVTSTDVVGYRLYMYAPDGSSMTSGTSTIPASANSSPAALATDTWGYNTSGSTTNFAGLATTPTVIADKNGPFKSGDATTVTYGLKTSSTKAAGSYTASVVYTAVNKSE